MAKKVTIVIAIFAVILSGCAPRKVPEASARPPDKRVSARDCFKILSGALAWSRKDWAMAASAFLDAEQSATGDDGAVLRAYAAYGLASTYLAQDEYDSALARLAEVGEDSSGEIGAGVWYQAGIIAFRKGEFDEAASMFRKSLERDPAQVDAKINLELSRRNLAETEAKQLGNGSASVSQSGDDDADTIFNLIRKKEHDRWKNQEKPAPVENVADY